MNKLSVRYLVPEDPDALSLFESLSELHNAIRQRAFGLFEERGPGHGSEMEDWSRAEHDMVWVPASETFEDDKQFRLRLRVPGLKAKDLQITAMPDAIIVQTEALSKETSAVPFRELRDRKVFRRFNFEEAIDPARTEASLSKGILEIVAIKAAPAKQVKVPIQSA